MLPRTLIRRVCRAHRSSVFRFLAESRYPGAGLLLGLLLGLSAPFVEGAPAEVRSFWVSLERGDDVAARDGSAQEPFRTLGYALSRAGTVEDPESPDLPPAEIRLEPGVHDADVETFPLRLPFGLTDVSLVGSPGTVLSNPSGDTDTIELDSYPAPGELRIAIETLTFRGGRDGVLLAALEGQSVLVEVTDCRFEGQSQRGVELQVGRDALGSLDVRGCVFGPTGGGILAEGSRGAGVDLHVRESLFQDLDVFGPASVLGAGVDAHLDPGGELTGSIERNEFRGTASAVVLSAAEPDPEGETVPGELDVKIVGNLMVGADSLGATRMQNAFHLSLWPHHALSLTMASNTIVGVGGHVVFQDNLDRLLDAGETVPFVFVNSICRGAGAASEFSSERAGEVFPPEGLVIRSNLLEKSRVALEEHADNFAADPGFADPEAGNFRLRQDSPAVDAASGDEVHLVDVDLDGSCRRAFSRCRLDLETYLMDLGAYEHPGYCDRDPDVFRRGDCNQSEGVVDITDAIFVFNFLFLGGEAPVCPDACDGNDDGGLDITDGIFTLTYLFTGGPPPAPPFASPGRDPSRDCLKSLR